MNDVLSDSERKQLRILKSVYDDPRCAGMWSRSDCERLVQLGYADRHAYAGFNVFSITEAGLRAADQLTL